MPSTCSRLSDSRVGVNISRLSGSRVAMSRKGTQKEYAPGSLGIKGGGCLLPLPSPPCAVFRPCFLLALFPTISEPGTGYLRVVRCLRVSKLPRSYEYIILSKSCIKKRNLRNRHCCGSLVKHHENQFYKSLKMVARKK